MARDTSQGCSKLEVSDGALCDVGFTERPVTTVSDHAGQWRITMVFGSDAWASSAAVEQRWLDHNVMNFLTNISNSNVSQGGS